MGKIKKFAKMKKHWGEIIETWRNKEKGMRRRNNIGQMKMNLKYMEGTTIISPQRSSFTSKEITRDCPMRHHKGC